MKFKPIAESMNVEVYASEENFLSFFNSPYYAHTQASAVDIYTKRREYDIPALSPVNGKVVNIVRFKTPKPKHFAGSEEDYIIAVQSNKNSSVWVRILHARPSVKIAQKVSVGDEIGKYLPSGYFNFWTDPHIHIEIRNPANIIRAKGGYTVNTLQIDDKEFNDEELVEGKPLEGKVELISKRYLILNLESPKLRLGNFYGIRANIGKYKGILDCGFPYYGYGGVHAEQSNGIEMGDYVKFLGFNIGIVVNKIKNFVMFKTIPLRVKIRDKVFKGLSFYLHMNELVNFKLVPIQPNSFSFKFGEKLKVEIT
ncbi:MAG: hypothetical protein QW265_05150 [Candidatus Bathyarchaeia archaeon]